mgnify:CR=1 FL=1
MTKPQRIRLLIAATLMQLLLGAIYAWSMFRAQISGLFPDFSAADLSLNFTLCMIGFALGGFLGGRLTARFSPKFSVRVAAGLLFLGYLGVSFMGSLPARSALILMYLCYGAVCGLGTGIGFNACLTGVSPWFPDRVGLVSGILLMGFGFGSLALGLVVQKLCETLSVFQVLRLCAVVIPCVLLLGSRFLRKPPSAAAPSQAVGTQSDGPNFTPLQMLTTVSFWVYFIWNVIMSASGQLIINSAANIAVYFGAAAGLGLVVSIFNGGGRPVTGVIVDKLGQFKGMLLMNGILITAGLLLVLTSRTGSLITMCIGMFAVGICYGGGVTISTKVIRDLYGPDHYSVNFSLSNCCSIPAAFLGPYISGLLQDRSGGGYASTFWMLTGMAALAFVLIFVLQLTLKLERR